MSKIRENALTYSHSFQFVDLLWLSILVLCHLDDLLSNVSEEIKTLGQRGSVSTLLLAGVPS